MANDFDTNTIQYNIIRRDVPRRGNRYQQPGYFALVAAPAHWDSTRPLSAACLATDGAVIVARVDVSDLRYGGERSQMRAALHHLDDLREGLLGELAGHRASLADLPALATSLLRRAAVGRADIGIGRDPSESVAHYDAVAAARA